MISRLLNQNYNYSCVEDVFYGNDPTGTISYNIFVMDYQTELLLLILEEDSPYSYSWTTGGNGQLEDNMPAGNHSVTVTDQICSETMFIELVEPDALIVNGTSSGDYNPFRRI